MWQAIITCALFEGAAFFNLIAYIIEGHKISLYTGAAFMALILVQIPSRQRMKNWIESRDRGVGDWPSAGPVDR